MANGLEGTELLSPGIFLDLPRWLTGSITNRESYGSVQKRNFIFVTEIDCF